MDANQDTTSLTLLDRRRGDDHTRFPFPPPAPLLASMQQQEEPRPLFHWDPSLPVQRLQMPIYQYPLPGTLSQHLLLPYLPYYSCVYSTVGPVPFQPQPPQGQQPPPIELHVVHNHSLPDQRFHAPRMVRGGLTQNAGGCANEGGSRRHPKENGIRLTDYNHCRLCRSNREPQSVYLNHILRDADGKVTCPILRALVCYLCGESGDNAHTLKYCPLNDNVPMRLRSHNFENTKAIIAKGMAKRRENDGDQVVPEFQGAAEGATESATEGAAESAAEGSVESGFQGNSTEEEFPPLYNVPVISTDTEESLSPQWVPIARRTSQSPIWRNEPGQEIAPRPRPRPSRPRYRNYVKVPNAAGKFHSLKY